VAIKCLSLVQLDNTNLSTSKMYGKVHNGSGGLRWSSVHSG
jgi:hypothetical protein